MKKIIFTLLAAILLGSASAGIFTKGTINKKVSPQTKKYIQSHYTEAKHLEVINCHNGISEVFFISNNSEYTLHFDQAGTLLQEEKEITHYQLPIVLQCKVLNDDSGYISQVVNFKGETYYSIEIEKNGFSKEYVYDQSGKLKDKGECNLIDYSSAENESFLLM